MSDPIDLLLRAMRELSGRLCAVELPNGIVVRPAQIPPDFPASSTSTDANGSKAALSIGTSYSCARGWTRLPAEPQLYVLTL
jgi:hypothetical protein